MENWYVATCKTGYGEQDRAEENLLNQLFEVFNPQIEVELIRNGSLVTKVEPIFPGYIFVKFNPEVLSAGLVNNSGGIRQLVTFGNVLAKMADSSMAELKERFGDKAKPVSRVPKRGDKIELKTGPMAGLEAIYHEKSGAKRSFLMIGLLGAQRKIEVENAQFS